jgi:hypothetical protein
MTALESKNFPSSKNTPLSVISFTSLFVIKGMFFSYNFLFISFLNTYDSTLNTSDNAVTKDTWISYLNNVDHLYLNPNANSIPAAPPPHITTFGI